MYKGGAVRPRPFMPFPCASQSVLPRPHSTFVPNSCPDSRTQQRSGSRRRHTRHDCSTAVLRNVAHSCIRMQYSFCTTMQCSSPPVCNTSFHQYAVLLSIIMQNESPPVCSIRIPLPCNLARRSVGKKIVVKLTKRRSIVLTKSPRLFRMKACCVCMFVSRA